MDFAGYKDCIVLENDNTRVILGPHCGGRVLEYSWKGVNSLYYDPSIDGYVWKPDDKYVELSGGRLDIGPEMVIPRHKVLWYGAWEGKPTGPRKAVMVSQKDKATGVQLERIFELDADSSHLRVTQVIHNVSDEPKEYCHWSRTLAPSGGTCVVPLTPNSRFPGKYIMYGPKRTILYRPKDPNIAIEDGFFVMKAPPERPKIGLDSYAGWLAYLTENNLLFVKKFPVYPGRDYNEVVAMTICLYYNKDFCELEPIGPRERIKPGESVSFTEDWWLFEYDKPSDPLDPKALGKFVSENTTP